MAKCKPNSPMPTADRAKQFAPFAALKGLPEALAEKEKIRVPRHIVSEDMAEEINRAITELKPGMIVTVVYYNEQEQEYLQLTGAVAKLYEYERILQIVKTKIKYDDIYEIIK